MSAVNAEARLWKTRFVLGPGNLFFLFCKTSQDFYFNLPPRSSLEGCRIFFAVQKSQGPMWPSDFPIELREYGPRAQGLDWLKWIVHSWLVNVDALSCMYAEYCRLWMNRDSDRWRGGDCRTTLWGYILV